MTRSVDQYAINDEKEFRRFVDPATLVDADDAVVDLGGGIQVADTHPMVTFRHVSTNDNTRTMIATMLPASGYVYCAGYVHAVAHNPGTSVRHLLALLGYLNSFTGDWWARRIVDRHVTAPVINNIPIPDWDSDQIDRVADIAAELSRRGGIGTLPGGHQIQSSDEHLGQSHHELIADIEVSVADGFDLSRADLEVVLDDFSEKACSAEFRVEILSRMSR